MKNFVKHFVIVNYLVKCGPNPIWEPNLMEFEGNEFIDKTLNKKLFIFKNVTKFGNPYSIADVETGKVIVTEINEYTVKAAKERLKLMIKKVGGVKKAINLLNDVNSPPTE